LKKVKGGRNGGFTVIGKKHPAREKARKGEFKTYEDSTGQVKGKEGNYSPRVCEEKKGGRRTRKGPVDGRNHPQKNKL